MAERPKAPVLKTGFPQGNGGSNPSLSAKQPKWGSAPLRRSGRFAPFAEPPAGGWPRVRAKPVTRPYLSRGNLRSLPSLHHTLRGRETLPLQRSARLCQPWREAHAGRSRASASLPTLPFVEENSTLWHSPEEDLTPWVRYFVNLGEFSFAPAPRLRAYDH